MEYLGTIKRSVDAKRRFGFPSKWLDDKKTFFFIRLAFLSKWLGDKKGFFFVQDGSSLKIYTRAKWKKIMLSYKKDEKKQAEWSGMSTEAEVDDQGRMILPKHVKWKKIDVIGMIDYVIIRESAE